MPSRPRPLTLALAAVSLSLLTGCPKPPTAKPPAPPAPVVVARAVTKTVPVRVRSIGSVKVLSTVGVRPRVGGELREAHFREGDFVKKGQRLFTLDPRPYEAALKQAEAALAREAAGLRGAEVDQRRIEQVGFTGAAAATELDTARTAVAVARANVAAGEAAAHSARLQLSFTTITSPIDGRTGNMLVTPGNLLSATEANPLVVINQISPIAVAVALPEQELPAVTAALRKGPMHIEAALRDGGPPIPGKLAFVDNAVDAGTGTVQLKAEFKNEDRKLWPGQFVDVVLFVGERPNSVVVASAAVQSGQQGQYVFTVADDKTAQQRPVTVAFEADGESVVESGLADGDTVVTEGQIRLAPGVKVEVKNTPSSGKGESK